MTTSAAEAIRPEIRQNGVPANETRRQRFVRIIDPRVSKAIKAIRKVGEVGGKTVDRYYEFGEEDVLKIIAALEVEVGDAKQALLKGKQSKSLFSLLD